MIKVMDKVGARNLIVKLVMAGWPAQLEQKYGPRFKSYVLSLNPDARVENRGSGFSLVGVKGVKCHHSTEAGVWALTAKELAR